MCRDSTVRKYYNSFGGWIVTQDFHDPLGGQLFLPSAEPRFFRLHVGDGTVLEVSAAAAAQAAPCVGIGPLSRRSGTIKGEGGPEEALVAFCSAHQRKGRSVVTLSASAAANARPAGVPALASRCSVVVMRVFVVAHVVPVTAPAPRVAAVTTVVAVVTASAAGASMGMIFEQLAGEFDFFVVGIHFSHVEAKGIPAALGLGLVRTRSFGSCFSADHNHIGFLAVAAIATRAH